MTGLTQRFPLRFEPWFKVLSTLTAVPPSAAWLEVGPQTVTCRMGWAFRATVPHDAVISAERWPGRTPSRGVHGFAGRWLVNGSGKGLVSILIDPPQRAFAVGFPIKLRELIVSVDDPPAVMAALRAGASAGP